ncbi:MAG: ATP-binding protein, partial [Anaerolineae bacterium]
RLRQYVLDFGDRTGLDISLDTEGEPILSLQEEIHLFRIVQEALANVHKHARAQRAWVRLQAGPEGTCLEVEDDGTGMSSETYPPDPLLSDVPEHFGLRIMQERAEAIGGRLSLHSVPGQGTRLQVLVTAQQVPASYLLSPSPEGK